MADENSKQTLFYHGNIITSKPVPTYDMSALQLPEDREEDTNGLVFANVSDTTGGLRGELLTKGGKLNLTSFGNCKCLGENNLIQVEEIAEKIYRALVNSRGYNGTTKEEVINGILKALESNKGTCYCCMLLNSEWENLPVEYDYMDNAFHAELPMAGVSKVLFSESYMQFGGREGINMMSMLFCQYGGGIISAKESGQGNNNFDHLTEEEMLFVATIYGEAGGCSEIAWQVIANVIMNRSMDQHWSKYTTITEIINKSGFDAHTHQNDMYKIAEAYLENRDYSNAQIEKMINAVIPIYRGQTADISNGATLYYSPNAQKELHDKYPDKYREKPNWDFSQLEETKIKGTENDDFLFYRYK